MPTFKELAEDVENLRDSYNFNDKERLLDRIADSFDNGVITEGQALDFFTEIHNITMRAFD